MTDIIIGFLLALAVMGSLVLATNRGRWRTPDWLVRLGGGIPWAPGLARVMSAVPSAKSSQHSHEVYFVPRQEIAECGLECPKCHHEVAERGDFSQVSRAIVDGHENEVIKCRGVIDFGDGRKPAPCPAWLAASPNTEHGDNLIEGDPPEFYVFSRITQEQALKEKYGLEIGQGLDGLVADPQQRPEGATFSDAIPWSSVCVKEPQPATIVPPRGQDETRVLPILTDPPKDT